MKKLVAIILCGCGCIAAPREVETTIELGTKTVEIDVRLRDIRAASPDSLNQLRTFGDFSGWNPEWTNELSWAPTPTRFEYLADAGRLDLAMHGSMTRSDFDACARAGSDAGVCKDFPLELGKSGYSVRPEILELKSLIIDPRARTTWAADAGRIACRVGLSAEKDTFISEGPSLLPGFLQYRSDPTRAVETLKRIKASEALFTNGSIADWSKELTSLEACTELPWCALRQEAVRRDQANLVYTYLRSRGEAGDAIQSPFPTYVDYFSAPTALVPKDALSLIDDLRLRIRYDVVVQRARSQGPTVQLENPWAPVCRPDTMRKPSLKDFCARLGVRAKR